MEPWKNSKQAVCLDYVPTLEWCRYLSGAPRRFRRGIAGSKADARCAAMFDREIAAMAALMKTDALRQKQRHLEILRQNRQELQGQRVRWTRWLEDLRRDLQVLEQELEALG